MYNIEICGVDGSGKTQAVKLLVDTLRGLGYAVALRTEVGDPMVGHCADLRKIVLDCDDELGDISKELVFAAMRLENDRYYLETYPDADFVISDRGWLCHLAYTAVSLGTEFTNIFYQGLMSTLTPPPALTILMDADPAVTQSRRTQRKAAIDAIEGRGERFLSDVSAAYRIYAKTLPGNGDNVRIIDANQDIEGVSCQISDLAQELHTAFELSQADQSDPEGE